MNTNFTFCRTLGILCISLMLLACSARTPLTSNATTPTVVQVPFDATVADVQRKLITLGATLEVDGQTGPKTRRAIGNFQRNLGQEPTGEITEWLISNLTRQASMKADFESNPNTEDTGQATHWAFAATPNRFAHGVAVGSSELWATEMAKRACRTHRDSDPENAARFPCAYARKWANTEQACISFLWTNGSSPKFYGIAYGADKTARMKESMQKAVDACGDPALCGSFTETGTNNSQTYCTEDLFQ